MATKNMLVREITSESSSFHRCQGSIDEFTLSGKCGIALSTLAKIREEREERERESEVCRANDRMERGPTLSGFAFTDKR